VGGLGGLRPREFDLRNYWQKFQQGRHE